MTPEVGLWFSCAYMHMNPCTCIPKCAHACVHMRTRTHTCIKSWGTWDLFNPQGYRTSTCCQKGRKHSVMENWNLKREISKSEGEKPCGMIGELFIVSLFGLCVLGMLECQLRASWMAAKYSTPELQPQSCLISGTFSPRRLKWLVCTVSSQLQKTLDTG